MTASKLAYMQLRKILEKFNEMGLEDSNEAEMLREVMDQLSGWCAPQYKLGGGICSSCGKDNTDYHSDDWAS